MSLEELIRSRRTIHSYTNEKVSDELVQKALSLGLWSLNHKLTFPWRFVAVSDGPRRELAELAVELKSAKAKEPMSTAAIQSVRDGVTTPSHYIALSMVRSDDQGRLWEDFATIACSVQIISLFLWEHNIGTKWSTGGFTTHDKTYRILDVNPATEKLVGGLYIGKFSAVPKSAGRPELERFLRKI